MLTIQVRTKREHEAKIRKIKSQIMRLEEPKNTINQLLCVGNHELFGGFSTYFVLMQLLHNEQQTIWLKGKNDSDYLYPNAVANLGINLQNITFITYQKQQQALWIMEEALRSGAVGTVVAEGVKQPNLLQSRRLNLAAEKGHAKSFMLLQGASQNTNSAMTRWQIGTSTGLQNQYQVKLLRSRQKGFISGEGNWIMDIENEKFYIDTSPAFGAQQISA